uniref:Crumbs cell polarity complex component 1 n=1 Tax=Sphaeramia orbicularis TaxID=375764 RepID=A0A673AIV2_9TELE
LHMPLPYHPPGFLGCFRDVFVGSRLVVPVRSQADFQANVTLGCSDRDKCMESPCQNRGRCVSLGWRSYSCECHRPYEGTDCTEEYVTARFGNKDLQSYAVFSLDGSPGDAVTVSMFIRTRQPRGLLLVLANSTSQYLRLWMEDGRVKVQVHNFETLVGRTVVNDGHFHLVTVKLDASMAFLFQSTQIQATMHVRNIQAHQGDQVFVGGLPDPRASASFGGYFKGCVQDLRVNTRRLQFYPITTSVESNQLRELVHVERGCSSDNACAVNPCLNDGVCYSMWDDFICNCPPNTAGQRCEEVKWCALSPCPTSAVCQPRSQGFECLSNVTFRAESRPLHYRSNGKIKRSLDSVSLSFRSRQSSATLLHAQKDSHFLTVSVQDSNLVLDLQVGVYRSAPHVTSLGPVSDGEWHTVELNMENHTSPNSPWILNLDGGRKEELLVTPIRAGGLDFLRDSADVFLGGMNLDSGAGLSGCLGPVNMGGILLPFHLDSELNLPRPQEEQFVRVNVDAAPRYGCWGSSVCAPNPCQNQGVCEDLFDLHHCTCPPEWTGTLCRDPTDSCVSSPCIHGNCINLSGRYKCACEPGFSGERCEAEVDMCENSNCSSGATCLKGFQSYSCLCPHNLTGPLCRLPQLPVSTCMGRRWNYSCFNGGNCSREDHTCSCLPGFTGEW